MPKEELNAKDDRVAIVICVFFPSRSSEVLLLLSAHCCYPFTCQYNTIFTVVFFPHFTSCTSAESKS